MKDFEQILHKYPDKISVLPAILTLANAVCGTFAILSALSLDFERSAYYIIFSLIFDALDGKISRLTKTASQFGIQLDSLADVISFGLAPAIISWVFLDVENYLNINIQNGIAIIYICCAIIRLAKFNVETDTSEESHLFFKGLPSPGAALFVIFNLLFLHNLLNFHLQHQFVEYLVVIYKYLLPIIIFISGILMITNIRYVHIFNISLTGKKSKKNFIKIVMLLSLITIKPLWSFFLLSWAFVLYPLYCRYISVYKKKQELGVPTL
ncbi:MAG: CDP-diacylglycerol--serine O-phosphatidyltransferase [Planctomycetota bacterium]